MTNPTAVILGKHQNYLAASIVLGACCLFALGFCASAAGQSAANSHVVDSNAFNNVNDDHVKSYFVSQASGYGFASFCFILCFLMFLGAAVIVSPLVLALAEGNSKQPQEAVQTIDNGVGKSLAEKNNNSVNGSHSEDPGEECKKDGDGENMV